MRSQVLMLGVVVAGLGLPGIAIAQGKLVAATSIPDPKGSPDIRSIERLGVRKLAGSVGKGTRDGAAGPGELIFVGGKNFGKKPEVKIAGQVAKILGRTADGGAVVAVPPGTPVGTRPVTVATGKGEPSLSGFAFKRFAMVSIPRDKTVHVVQLSEAGSLRSAQISVQSPEDLRFSSDGSAGYILDGKKGGGWNVIALDMTATDKPVSKGVIMKRKADVSSFLTARHAPGMVIIDSAGIDVFSLVDPLAPRKVATTPLPKVLAEMTIQTAEIAPDGKSVAVLGNDKNRVVILRIDAKGQATVAGRPMDVLAGYTGEHASRALRYSPDGKTVWVISGGNPTIARKGAKEFTRLSSVEVPASGDPVMGKVRVLKGARAPRDFVVTWGRRVQGNFDPNPPDDVAMVLAAAPEKLFEVRAKDLEDARGRKRVLKAIGPKANPGLLYKMNAKGGEPVGLKMSTILLDVEVTPDTSKVVCFGLQAKESDSQEDVEFEVGVASAPAAGAAKNGVLKTGFIGLSKITPQELKPPFRYGEVRVQP